MTSRSDRTEKATPKRLRDSKRKGQLPKSQEVSVAFSLLLLVITAALIMPLSGGVVLEEFGGMLQSAGNANLTGGTGSSALRMMVATVLPVLAMAVVAALAAGFAQVGFAFAPLAAKPKLSHLSIKKGLQRFKPSKAAWELVRSTLKIGLLVLLAWGPLTSITSEVASLRGFNGGIESILNAAWQILFRVALMMLVIGAGDYAIQRFRNRKELRMTKVEVKREVRENEGTPELKALRRRRAAELSRNCMIKAAGGADVIVTNTTHLAVALKYEADEPAPRLVARGANELARRMQKEARRHGVPVFEDKSLARALFRKVKVGAYVPTALFEAVALILALAYRRRVHR